MLPALLVLGLLMPAVAGCDLAGSEDTGGIVSLTGQVLNADTNNPVPNAFVRVLPLDLLFEADELGFYTFDVEIDSTMDLRVQAAKEGFSTSTTTVLALAGRTINVPTLRLNFLGQEEQKSGKASNMILLGQSASSIGVKESGAEEVASMTFQLADSLGRPVIVKNAADVRFKFGVKPGGGEFIFPTSSKTDNNGQVTVNLSSGTRAGVVQVIAETTVDGRVIRSSPVSVTIHGGMPDQPHFSVGPSAFNFAGLRKFGLKNAVSVIVGDKYGNPVREKTSVYFTTSHGIIEGSILTDAEGRGSVDLISANPLPSDGVAIITATTADENEQVVMGQTPVVFSGTPVVTISPTVARLNETYHMTVTDYNGNPLVENTNINVKVLGSRVKAVGHTNVFLDDTAFIGGMGYENIVRGHGITDFTFSAVENLRIDEEGTPSVKLITITIGGPNGFLEIVLDSQTGATTRTQNATMEVVGQKAVFRIPEPEPQDSPRTR